MRGQMRVRMKPQLALNLVFVAWSDEWDEMPMEI
jgi:hypothetical protein